ncbi:MAG: hypothetical protein QF560_18360 [SAR324 cluster bacterium]|jgi:hypothetical protein|nr:hypothetical protein [Deltaproteobacteria bacterium]MDP6093443.1 hypothetical protein [SAR324 cluster bacterium]MDP7140328.1 hypothetical protein [SAR324 cluster bacterium]MDP7334093.1 hypothetical protein [SAR324 cluster bacterium]MDP7501974.1 hypothetical protein [SAR324 cluster bacterium]
MPIHPNHQKTMQLWGVFHVKESGELNQTPRVICDSQESAEKALKRFPLCRIASYQPPPPTEAESGTQKEEASG